MSRYFIIEVKDKHITRHDIFLALVEKLGLGVVVTVEPASQQSFALDAATVAAQSRWRASPHQVAASNAAVR